MISDAPPATRAQNGFLLAQPRATKAFQVMLAIRLRGALLVASDPLLVQPAAVGGLMSYGTRITNAYRQVGVYTGRILKGAKQRLKSIDADIESLRSGGNIPVDSQGARCDGMLIGAFGGRLWFMHENQRDSSTRDNRVGVSAPNSSVGPRGCGESD